MKDSICDHKCGKLNQYLKIVCLVSLLFVMGSVSAQNGLTLRVGASSLMTSWETFTPKGYIHNGWHVGASARFGEDRFFMNPGLLYQSISILSQKGVFPIQRGARLTLLGFSMLAGYRLIKTRPFTMRIHTGVGANYVTTIDDNAFGLDLDSVEALHFQAIGDIGFDFYWLTLDVRYSYGLSNIFKNQTSKGNYMLLSLGFFI